MLAELQPLIITEFLRNLLQANSSLFSILIPTLTVELGVRASTIYAWFNGQGDVPLRHLSAIIRTARNIGYDLQPFRSLLNGLFNPLNPEPKSLRQYQSDILILLGQIEEQNLHDEHDLTARESIKIMELSQRLLDLGNSFQQILIRNALLNDNHKNKM